MKSPFKYWITVSLMLSGISLSAPAEVIDQLPMDGYAAVVNERIVTIGDVMMATYQAQERLRMQYNGTELTARREEMFYAGLERLIDNVLIIEDFKSQEGAIPERAIDDRINTIIYENFNNDKPSLLAALVKDGVTLEEWRETIHENIIVGAMRQNEIGSRIVISPKQIIEAYDSSNDGFTQPEQVKLSLIFIKSGNDPDDTLKRVEEARDIIIRNDSFSEVAKSVSDDATSAVGGDWGWVDPSSMRDELKAAIDGLTPGQVSELIFTAEGYYLLQVEERKESYSKSLSDVRTEIESQLRATESERLYRDWMKRLRQKHSVMYFIPRPPDQS